MLLQGTSIRATCALTETHNVLQIAELLGQRDRDENAPLIASAFGDIAIVKVLLEAGADTLAVNANEYNFLRCAAADRHEKVLKSSL